MACYSSSIDRRHTEGQKQPKRPDVSKKKHGCLFEKTPPLLCVDRTPGGVARALTRRSATTCFRRNAGCGSWESIYTHLVVALMHAYTSVLGCAALKFQTELVCMYSTTSNDVGRVRAAMRPRLSHRGTHKSQCGGHRNGVRMSHSLSFEQRKHSDCCKTADSRWSAFAPTDQVSAPQKKTRSTDNNRQRV